MVFRSGFTIGGYDRVAFETDLPRIESTCDRSTGTGCTLLPAGATFYPFYSTVAGGLGCIWQLGGANIPGTRDTFGQLNQYGTLLSLTYTAAGGGTVQRFNDFRQILPQNPCRLFDETSTRAFGPGSAP